MTGRAMSLPTARECPPTQRSDAARNQARILEAAERLFASHGVANVSMDAIAAEAGVGKGTVFRRFGSKAGLAVALLDAQDHALQAAILSGPPPLGAPAPARDRLLAFFDAYLRLLSENLELVHMSETASPGARYRIGSYRFWRQHVELLLGEHDSALDAECAAHAVLALFSSELHLAFGLDGIEPARIRDTLSLLLERLLPVGDGERCRH
jgi:AcrR family transcriptional regulator